MRDTIPLGRFPACPLPAALVRRAQAFVRFPVAAAFLRRNLNVHQTADTVLLMMLALLYGLPVALTMGEVAIGELGAVFLGMVLLTVLKSRVDFNKISKM